MRMRAVRCIAFGDLSFFRPGLALRSGFKIKLAVALLIALGLPGSSSAESCSKSRDYILAGFVGALSGPAELFRESFKICLEALTLVNVQDAFVLRDGSIAIVPVRNTTFATAQTLAQFCQRFPKGTVHFLTPKKNTLSVGLVVTKTPTATSSCKNVLGTG